MKRIGTPQELSAIQEQLKKQRDPNKPLVTICAGTGCHGHGCIRVQEALEPEIKKQGVSEKVELRATGCHGFCERGPLVVIRPQIICYMNVETKDIPQIVSDTVLKGEVIDRLLYHDPISKDKIVHERGHSFL